MSLELFAIGSSGLALAVIAVMVLTRCADQRGTKQQHPRK